ncbi:unnamed protein product [Rotaria sordida]|uniref:Uncharacterized protein n=1 Tax=Rotaria sordida TaxID=392033 RepID=A0A814GFE9_9BILA|nr:unnamed protein product [Rotaria sordida]
MTMNYLPPPQDAIDTAEELLINCYSFGWTAKLLNDLRGMMAAVRIKDRSRKNIAASLPPSTMAFRQHCLRCSRQLKIWLDSLESHSIPPAMSHYGYEYSLVINRFKIKWSTLSDQPNDYRLETCGDCQSGCTRCKCFKNNLSCTIFCKCNHEICFNRTSYSFSSDKFNDQDLNDLESTTASMESDNELDIISIKSQSNNINNKSVAESDMDVVSNQSYEDSQLEYSNFDKSKLVNHTLYSSIKNDHTYCSNDDLEIVTPKRRKLSSLSLNSSNSQLIFQSPCAYFSPKFDDKKDTFTSSVFKTPLMTITSTPRHTARFRKSYGKTKTHSQPNN